MATCAPCAARTEALRARMARKAGGGPLTAGFPCEDCKAGQHEACTLAAGKIVIPVQVGAKTVPIERTCSCLLAAHAPEVT